MGRGEVSGGKEETFEWRTESPLKTLIRFRCVDSIMKLLSLQETSSRM